MFRLTFLLFIFLIFAFIAEAQSNDWQHFIPANFTILDSASGDLNRDGKRDMVIILQNRYEESNADTTRPLLLLFGDDRGRFNLVASNDSTVMCKGCGGAFGDPYAGITVKNNFFSIEHYGGSSWRWTRIITFRYDARTRQFILHRDAGESFHISDPEKTKQHVYNKKDFGKLLFSDFSYRKEW